MQHMSSYPGNYSTVDLNLDAKSDPCFPSNSGEIVKSEHYYGGLFPSLAPSTPFDIHKEALRQTILKHELVFKDQVRELHRLYIRQKVLMSEMKWRDQDRYNLQVETSHPYSFPSQITSGSQKTWYIPSMPLENIQHSLCFTNEKITFTGQTDFRLNNCKMFKSKPGDSGRKMLDLELPVDEHINNEEESLEGVKVSEAPELPSCHIKRNSDVLSERDVPNCVRRTNGLADLNTSIKVEESEALNSISFLGPATCERKFPCGNLLQNLNSGFQYNSGKNVECSSSVLHMEKERREDWFPYGDAAGKSRREFNHFLEGFSSSKFPPFKPTEVGYQNELTEIHPQGNRNKSQVFGLQVPHDLSSSSSNSLRLLPMHGSSSSHQLVPHADSFNSGSSSRKKPIHDVKRSPIAVQALPCFNTLTSSSKRSKSLVGSSAELEDKFHLTRNSRLSPCVGSASYFQNTSRCVPDLDSMAANHFQPSTGPGYLNRDKDSGSYSQHYRGNSKDLNSMGVRSAMHMNLNLNLSVDEREPGFSQGKSSCDVEKKMDEQSNQQDNERDLGFPTHISSTSSSKSRLNSSEDENIENSNEAGLIDINVAFVATPDDVETELEKKLLDSGTGFDLNSCLNEDEFLPQPSISKALTDIEADIELEAPISPETKEHSPPRGESDENQLKTPSQLSEQESGGTPEELVNIAAATLVSISASRVQTWSEASHSESLHWFASTVASVVGSLEREQESVSSDEVVVAKRSLSSPGIDYFEVMTLNLTETKVEQYSYKTNEEREEEGAVSISQTRSRKGRMRIGRRQRDFQSEILPSLASLSRHEVTEDLQALGGSINNASRNGLRKGRRRTHISSLDTVESMVRSPVKKQGENIELRLQEMSLITWGKITRRRRGSRCPATNPPLIVSQV